MSFEFLCQMWLTASTAGSDGKGQRRNEAHMCRLLDRVWMLRGSGRAEPDLSMEKSEIGLQNDGQFALPLLGHIQNTCAEERPERVKGGCSLDESVTVDIGMMQHICQCRQVLRSNL